MPVVHAPPLPNAHATCHMPHARVSCCARSRRRWHVCTPIIFSIAPRRRLCVATGRPPRLTRDLRVLCSSKEEEAFKQSGLAGGKGSGADVVKQSLAQGAALQQQMKSANVGVGGAPGGGGAVAGLGGLRFSDELAFKEALPVPRLPGQQAKPTGLQGLLATIDGKKKMTTMEKSKHECGAAHTASIASRAPARATGTSDREGEREGRKGREREGEKERE
eukprot:1079988-Prymnesium_polylepis.1